MTDDVRAAMNEVRHGEDAGCKAHEHRSRALARAFLVLFPADDAEPVTAEWLRAAGWTGDGDEVDGLTLPGHRLGFALRGVHGPGELDWQAFRVGGDGFDGSEDYLCVAPTRGHVRRLCSCLEVPLKREESDA